MAHEALDDAALEQVLLDDLRHVLGVHVLVEDAVRVDERHGALHARPEATGLDDAHLAGELASASSARMAALTSSAPEAMQPPPVQISS